jgi:hypothetical protein
MCRRWGVTVVAVVLCAALGGCGQLPGQNTAGEIEAARSQGAAEGKAAATSPSAPGAP